MIRVTERLRHYVMSVLLPSIGYIDVLLHPVYNQFSIYSTGCSTHAK